MRAAAAAGLDAGERNGVGGQLPGLAAQCRSEREQSRKGAKQRRGGGTRDGLHRQMRHRGCDADARGKLPPPIGRIGRADLGAGLPAQMARAMHDEMPAEQPGPTAWPC